MTTAAGSLQIVPESPPSAPALRAADRGVAEALESVLSDNTKRVYHTQWKLFDEWCGDVSLRALPADPLTVARYLDVRANAGASIATLRLATSAIAQGTRMGRPRIPRPGPGGARLFERMGTASCEAPASGRRPHRRRACRDPAHRSETPCPRPRPRNGRAGRPAGEVRRGPGGRPVRRRIAAVGGFVSDLVSWGDVVRWDDGSGRITVVRSKTDAEAQGAVVAITPVAMRALDAIRPAGVGGEVKVFGLSESQIARRVKAIARAAGLADWEFFSGHSGRVGMARRMAQNGAPTHEIERQGRWKQGGGMVGRYTRGESAGSALRYL